MPKVVGRYLWDAVKPRRNEGFLWEQLSDGAYDQFMMTQQRAGLL